MAVRHSVKRESSNVKSFGESAMCNPTFHLSRFTVPGNEAGGLFQHPARGVVLLSPNRGEEKGVRRRKRCQEPLFELTAVS